MCASQKETHTRFSLVEQASATESSSSSRSVHKKCLFLCCSPFTLAQNVLPERARRIYVIMLAVPEYSLALLTTRIGCSYLLAIPRFCLAEHHSTQRMFTLELRAARAQHTHKKHSRHVLAFRRQSTAPYPGSILLRAFEYTPRNLYVVVVVPFRSSSIARHHARKIPPIR